MARPSIENFCWIVEGRTGEYEDQENWVVRVYYGSAAKSYAINHVNNAKIIEKRLCQKYLRRITGWDGEAKPPRKGRNPFDPHRDDGEVSYSSYKAPLSLAAD